MKSIVCEQPERLIVQEVPEPSYKQGEALIRIRRIGICGTDLHAYKGNQPFFSYPRVLGHELAGIIERVGENSAGLRQGDQVSVIPYLECGHCIACRNNKTNCCTELRVLGVHIDGGMREVISVPVDHVIKTEGLTLDQTAIVEPLSIGAHALSRSGLKEGETALVIGAGPIGLGVMALAKQRGAQVIAMDINDERLAFCRTWTKADHTVNALRTAKEELLAITNGDLPTVVFDATGNIRSMTDSFQWVAHGGKLIFVGLVKADISFHDPEFHKREVTLLSSRNATREDFVSVIEAIRSGAINVDGYITHRVDFAQMVESFDQWLKVESNVIKAMVEV
jgi:2-desacetyl-2-hydroxyethyl bacteriochlorophyllide A dehydrogenase